MCLAQNGHAAIVKQLIKKGANVHATNYKNKNQPLHVAAQKGVATVGATVVS